VTNYGLGGLCESHADPHGYLDGLHLPPERQHLVYTGTNSDGFSKVKKSPCVSAVSDYVTIYIIHMPPPQMKFLCNKCISIGNTLSAKVLFLKGN
jgi:hypothetical protein